MSPRTWSVAPRPIAAWWVGLCAFTGSLPTDVAWIRVAGAAPASLQPGSDPGSGTPTPPPTSAPSSDQKPEPPATSDQDAPTGDDPPADPAEQGSRDPREEREARVVMTDGRTFTGVVVERSDEYVVLKISGIRTPFPTRDIDKIDLFPTNRERYDTLREALDPKDLNGRLRLAEWLRSVDMLDESIKELDAIIAADPANAKARDFRTIVEQQIRLKKRSLKNRPAQTGDGEEEPDPDARDTKDATTRKRQPEFPLLSERDINLIRVYELNLADPPRIRIQRGVIDRLMEAYAGDERIPTTREGRDAMHRKRPAEIVDLMFQLRARDFYDDVQVMDDPESMRRFREHVHATWLLNACASNDCHGGTDAGRLRLHNRNRNSSPTVYTNFLILDRFDIEATRGERKGERVPLIDYANPSRSPLLQLALPRDESLFPHPEVNRPGVPLFKPVFRTKDDPRFRRAVEWIESLYQPRPDYGITYEPPAPNAKSAGATPAADPSAPPAENDRSKPDPKRDEPDAEPSRDPPPGRPDSPREDPNPRRER